MTEGLSREEFEKQLKAYANQYDGPNERAIAGFGFQAGYAAASSLKQAEPNQICRICGHKAHPAGHCGYSVGAMDTGCECKFEGKQTEPELCAYPGCGEPKSAVIHRTEFGAYVDNRPRHNFMTEGKQAPPSQPERCPSCGYTEEDAKFNMDHHLCRNAGKTLWEVAESTSQASTQPKCNCGAGDDAYLACHADVCALKKWAAPRYEISQATKEEWARRIADDRTLSNGWLDSNLAYKRVLALMTNEGV